jgi:hypothetical protein
MIQVRNYMIFLVIALYMVLNSGFMQLRILAVAGGGVPIGELVLILSVLTIRYSTQVARLSSIVYLVPFIIWWVYGIAYSLSAVPEYGMWALRDANQIIESLFLLVGLACVVKPKESERFFKWLPLVLGIVCVYSLGYPYMHDLQSFTPKIVAGAGQDVAIFFNYTNTSLMLLMSAAYLLIFYSERNLYLVYVLAVIIIAYAVLLFQARTVYLQVIALFFLFLIYRRKVLGKVIVGIILVVCALLLLPSLGLHISGRLGQDASIGFVFNHFMSIGGIESEGLEGAAGGVGLRLGWWLDLYERWTQNTKTFIFGLGYGFPLVDFGIANGVMVREPHNSYISVLARGGIIGAIMWSWMHFLLLRVWRRLYYSYGRYNDMKGQNRILILMVYFVLIWVFAIGEDAFEKPFLTIPYYFFWGVILRLSYNQKRLLTYA